MKKLSRRHGHDLGTRLKKQSRKGAGLQGGRARRERLRVMRKTKTRTKAGRAEWMGGRGGGQDEHYGGKVSWHRVPATLYVRSSDYSDPGDIHEEDMYNNLSPLPLSIILLGIEKCDELARRTHHINCIVDSWRVNPDY
ncbi:hypothetical protein Tco_0800238 [Tanacetum coccineum]|uniref:Uncharacterized protein n=1 Tax=Tanacetum coccineum TaxID=301880 RepID=A0ABQ4ZSK0_9ASTR